jgi:translation initiation factor 2B subunit (eIF-2B alpha/beta/delta family)
VQDLDRCKQLLIERGEHFAARAVVAKQRIAEQGEQFIPDNAVREYESYTHR